MRKTLTKRTARACFPFILVLASIHLRGQGSAPQLMDYSHVSLQVQNDFLKIRGLTDRQFTQSIYIELLSSKYASRLGSMGFFSILPTFKFDDTVNNLGFGIGQDIYTPTNLSETEIIEGDRPYAGYLYLTLKNISLSFQKKSKLTSIYHIGVIGQNSLAREVQTGVHETFGWTIPEGWHNQIANDIGLNFYLQYETRIIQPIAHLDIIVSTELNLGTVSNNISTGLHYRIGRFNDYFTNATASSPSNKRISQLAASSKHLYPVNAVRKRFQVYGFVKTNLTTVLDNSFLEGGIFNQSSPHTIHSDDLKRFYLNGEYGIHLNYLGYILSFSQLFRTAEFTDAPTIFWGKIGLNIPF